MPYARKESDEMQRLSSADEENDVRLLGVHINIL